MKNHFFKIPTPYMERYGIGKVSGTVDAFTVHAVLPNWEGYNSMTEAKFHRVGHGDIITILVEGAGETLEEMETYWYKISYDIDLSYHSKASKIAPTKISANPDIIFLDGSYNKYTRDKYYYIEGEKVKAMLACSRPNTLPSPSCHLIMAYDDNIRMWVTFSQKYQSDWIGIFKKIQNLLRSFDQKLEQN